MRQAGNVTLAKKLGSKFQALRKAAGLSQEVVASKAGVARGALQQLEDGGNPTLKTILSVGEFLGFNPFISLASPPKTVAEMPVEELKYELAALKRDDIELARLRDENERLRTEIEQLKVVDITPTGKRMPRVLINKWATAEAEIRALCMAALLNRADPIVLLPDKKKTKLVAFLRGLGLGHLKGSS